MLDDILKVKNIREDKAIKELSLANHDLQHKVNILAGKKRKLKEYTEWRLAEEERIYKQIFGEEVRLLAVEVMRETIASMRLKGMEKEEKIFKSQKSVDDAKETLKAARHARMEAHKNVKKFEEYIDIVKKMENKEKERKEEIEMEEFKGKSLLRR